MSFYMQHIPVDKYLLKHKIFSTKVAENIT